MAVAKKCGYELLLHPAYSPYLAPNDYHLFSDLKKHVCGKRFDDDNNLRMTVEEWFDAQNVGLYRQSLEDLQKRWVKCINLEGDYLEN